MSFFSFSTTRSGLKWLYNKRESLVRNNYKRPSTERQNAVKSSCRNNTIVS